MQLLGLITRLARKAWRSFKFARVWVFFCQCGKLGYRSWVIPLAFLYQPRATHHLNSFYSRISQQKHISTCILKCLNGNKVRRPIAKPQYSKWTVGPLSSATCLLCLCSLLAACNKPVQRFYVLENAIDCVMGHAQTHKFQLSGPIVHSLYTVAKRSCLSRDY